MQAGPPGGHRTPIGVVVGTESVVESRFLIPAYDCRGEEPKRCDVEQETRLTQEERLTDDRRQDGHVHGIADITICAADDEAFGRCDWRRCPEPFSDEPYERLRDDE